MKNSLLFLLLVFVPIASASCAAESPNIVVLFADDAGYADFGFQPHVREDMRRLTPHIDSIAAEGVRCSNAYMSGCVCSPSRAGLMTGRYQQRFGHENNIPPGYMQGGLPLSECCGAQHLQKIGYTTGLVGKWHLGYPTDYQPNQRGFDWFFGCLQGSRSYFPYQEPTPHRVLQENGKPTREEGYVTDRLGDAACKFITEHKRAPFFLFVSFTAPHGPLQAKAEDLDQLRHIPNERRRKYAGLVKCLDDNVGKILQTLQDTGLKENTLVVFTNDNGGQTMTGANNFPLRGRKGTLWEGGTRVPWAMRWPGKIKPGLVVDDPIIALDLMPTFLAMAGGEVDPAWELDGTNLLDRITGATERLPSRSLFWRQHGKSGAIAIRDGQWKLIHNRDQAGAEPELYHLSTDISESKNVSRQHAERVAILLGKLQDWESQLTEPLWRTRAGKTRPRRR